MRNALLIASLVATGQALAAEQPAPGMTCTYTKQTAPAYGTPRMYAVEVIGPFEATQGQQGAPWLWVKRPADGNYQSFLATAADLSRCQR